MFDFIYRLADRLGDIIDGIGGRAYDGLSRAGDRAYGAVSSAGDGLWDVLNPVSESYGKAVIEVASDPPGKEKVLEHMAKHGVQMPESFDDAHRIVSRVKGLPYGVPMMSYALWLNDYARSQGKDDQKENGGHRAQQDGQEG